VSIRLHQRLRHPAIAILLCVGALYAGHLFAASSQDDSQGPKPTELAQPQGLAKMAEQSKAAGHGAATQTVRSLTEKILAQYPNLPPDKRMAIEAVSQRYLGDVDNSFDRYAAALRAIVNPPKVEPTKPQQIQAQPVQPGPGLPMPSPTSEPSVPDGKVVANSVADRCEAPPSADLRAHDVSPSGRSVLCVCVDEKGTLTQDPVIAESSGDSRVDSGAVKLARLDSGRYKPPAVDGKPQRGCFRFAVNFRHPE
jgi:hypothetical protein